MKDPVGVKMNSEDVRLTCGAYLGYVCRHLASSSPIVCRGSCLGFRVYRV